MNAVIGSIEEWVEQYEKSKSAERGQSGK